MRNQQLVTLKSEPLINYNDNPKTSDSGIGCAITRKYAKSLSNVRSISNRAAYVTCPLNNRYYMKIVYPPNTTHKDDEMDIFYGALSEIRYATIYS